MSKTPHLPRPSLPTSSTDFALRASSSTLQSPTDEFTGLNPLLFRFRRPSLLSPKYISESRLSSPLATSFTSPLRPSSASEVDRERIWADSGSASESSENNTPPLNGSEADKDAGQDSDSVMRTSRPQTPPPRNPSSSSMDVIAESSYLPHLRRLSHPPKLPRILNLVRESSRPDENEVKSEAQFQRLVASFSELPTQPRTPRAPSDRGRYPEEASEDRDSQLCQTPSDDSDYDEPDGIPFAFSAPTQEPITIRTRTPGASVSGSLCGDDPCIDSPGAAMDIDMPPSLFGSPAAASLHQWRYTPPPTASSAVRTSKRKHDDRFDPYPTSSKRRAVSPSVSYLRENHTSLSPIYIPRSGSSSRTPIPIPITSSAAGSVASSPISHSGTLPFASPTMRATMGLASPITRPMRMSRRIDGEDREVDGTGEAVNGLSLA
ncbi:hypothetical protein EDB92DRAFT_1858176 [Lactarius akahatsu]|uniref:Uncharacterized protein n=1 Tax=Lactarius akahatsu TaxID=416441 RepID=A0AAD4LHZ7_9AGAM|nr:hypothetical protein EDB92DRAFT_1858176 [Lactarius akahatsu]